VTSESGIPNAPPAAEIKTPAGEAPQATTEAVEALQDRLLRALADAENARRQAERARSEGRRAGVADLIARLAPGLDSLDLAVDAARGPDQDDETFARSVQEGLRAARRALLEAFQREGVERIEPLDQPFDPTSHEAVATRADPAAAPGHVLQVVQAGYRVGERLVRPARVVVSAAAPPAD
jgi:molecular chaperone GrpE